MKVTLPPGTTFISLSQVNPLSTNFTKQSNKLKQFVDKLPTNYLSVFEHFAGLALKRLKALIRNKPYSDQIEERYTICHLAGMVFRKIMRNKIFYTDQKT